MKKVMITLIMVIVCTAALFADAVIAENEETFILVYSADSIPDVEVPGKTWTYYERFEVTDSALLDQYMSRFMGYFLNFDSETLDMRVSVDGSDMVCIVTSDLELINSLAGI